MLYDLKPNVYITAKNMYKISKTFRLQSKTSNHTILISNSLITVILDSHRHKIALECALLQEYVKNY